MNENYLSANEFYANSEHAWFVNPVEETFNEVEIVKEVKINPSEVWSIVEY